MIAPTRPTDLRQLLNYPLAECERIGCPALRYVQGAWQREADWLRKEARDPRVEARRKLLVERPHCAYCGRRLRRRSATLDHVLPQSRGGTDTAENCVLACMDCNASKGDRTPIEWAADILAAVRL